MNKKTCGVLFIFVSVCLLTILIVSGIIGDYRFEKDYLQLWKLADKSSTIAAKQIYISKFVSALDTGYKNREFSRYDAIFLKTPNNGFTENFAALKSLSDRLEEIHTLNPNSFEYNTAIQQITAQEQGESHEMLSVLEGCYFLENYPFLWGWYCVIYIFSTLAAFCFGIWLKEKD